MRKNVAGISPVDIRGIENIDLSNVVSQVRRETTLTTLYSILQVSSNIYNFYLILMHTLQHTDYCKKMKLILEIISAS